MSGSDVYPVCDVFEIKTGNVITFAQFEEGKILTETRNNAESGDESDRESLMMNKQDMDNLNSNEQSDHDLISTYMLEEICDGSQTHPNVNKREERSLLQTASQDRFLLPNTVTFFERSSRLLTFGWV